MLQRIHTCSVFIVGFSLLIFGILVQGEQMIQNASQENFLLQAQGNSGSDSATCNLNCLTCLPSSSQLESLYSCTSCSSTSPERNLYIRSCQPSSSAITSSINYKLFLSLGIISLILHFFMLTMGYGMYSNIFSNIQLISLISWEYGSGSGLQTGVYQLQVTNLGILTDNDFALSYAPQSFLFISIQCLFWLMVMSVDRLPHNAMATLIKRKKITFPLRLEGFIFNMTAFSALSTVLTLNQNQSILAASFPLAIIAILKVIIVLGIILYISNFRAFQIDDPKYYILVQKFSTRRWFVRNYLGASMAIRLIVIVIFVAAFSQSQAAGISCTALLLGMTIHGGFAFNHYIKIRFTVLNDIANILTTAAMFCMYGCGTNLPAQPSWSSFNQAYFIIVICLVSMFIVACGIEIVSNIQQIKRQLRSIYQRFVICKKMDDQVKLNKYDSSRHREKVTSFRRNLIYDGSINGERHGEGRQIEMSDVVGRGGRIGDHNG